MPPIYGASRCSMQLECSTSKGNVGIQLNNMGQMERKKQVTSKSNSSLHHFGWTHLPGRWKSSPFQQIQVKDKKCQSANTYTFAGIVAIVFSVWCMYLLNHAQQPKRHKHRSSWTGWTLYPSGPRLALWPHDEPLWPVSGDVEAEGLSDFRWFEDFRAITHSTFEVPWKNCLRIQAEIWRQQIEGWAPTVTTLYQWWWINHSLLLRS